MGLLFYFDKTSAYYLAETHLYVGNLVGLPIPPSPGQFPYKTSYHDNGVQSVTYTIPLSELPDCYVIAAHSTVVETPEFEVVDGDVLDSETAWSFGTEFFPGEEKGRWGWYSNYCTQVCEEEPNHET